MVQDNSGTVVNNTDAKCNIEAGGLLAGDTRQCQKTLWMIMGKIAQKVGYNSWDEMFDDQKPLFGVTQKGDFTRGLYKQ